MSKFLFHTELKHYIKNKTYSPLNTTPTLRRTEKVYRCYYCMFSCLYAKWMSELFVVLKELLYLTRCHVNSISHMNILQKHSHWCYNPVAQSVPLQPTTFRSWTHSEGRLILLPPVRSWCALQHHRGLLCDLCTHFVKSAAKKEQLNSISSGWLAGRRHTVLGKHPVSYASCGSFQAASIDTFRANICRWNFSGLLFHILFLIFIFSPVSGAFC